MTARDRSRRLELKAVGNPAPARSLGARVVRSPQFQKLAVKALGTTENARAYARRGRVAVDARRSPSQGADRRRFGHVGGGVQHFPARRLHTAAAAAAANPRPGPALRNGCGCGRVRTPDQVHQLGRSGGGSTSTTTGTKPEATIAFEKVTAPVATYATWAPVTRRGLSEMGELRDVVDGQLTLWGAAGARGGGGGGDGRRCRRHAGERRRRAVGGGVEAPHRAATVLRDVREPGCRGCHVA